ncbi:response regulator transcription factor [Chloroflexota bacterium]
MPTKMRSTMSRLLIIAQETEALAGLCSGLIRDGFTCSIIPHGNGLVKELAARRPDLVMLEMDGYSADDGVQELAQKPKQGSSLPVIALVTRDNISGINSHLDVDDFIISPYDNQELALRIKRLLNHRTESIDSGELIKCDGLVIDLAKCEVTLEGKVVELTFKEYELLKFLASNKGRVFTRDALLNMVWGYDYYGGDRTVDVHIRRLRSKIEQRNKYIDTIRNIGYRFREV